MRVALSAAVLGLIAGLIAGGRIANLSGLRLRRIALVVVFPLGVGLASWNVPGAFAWYVIGHLAFVVFAFSNALPVRGMLIVGVGLTLNLSVIADNHGMPYRPSSVVSAGAAGSRSADLVPRTSVMSHPEGPGDQLMVLSKIIPVAPLREVVSFGDVLVAIGLALLVFHGVVGDGVESSVLAPGGRARRCEPDDSGAARPTLRERLAATGLGSPAARSTTLADDAAERDRSTSADRVGTSRAGAAVPVADQSEEPAELQEPSLPDKWDQRLGLLRATGDITVVLDLIEDERSEGATSDQAESLARLAVARALRSSSEGSAVDA